MVTTKRGEDVCYSCGEPGQYAEVCPNSQFSGYHGDDDEEVCEEKWGYISQCTYALIDICGITTHLNRNKVILDSGNEVNIISIHLLRDLRPFDACSNTLSDEWASRRFLRILRMR